MSELIGNLRVESNQILIADPWLHLNKYQNEYYKELCEIEGEVVHPLKTKYFLDAGMLIRTECKNNTIFVERDEKGKPYCIVITLEKD